MTRKDKSDLQFKIEDEGFDYAILNYSSDIKDTVFQEERAAFLNARESFAEYLRSVGIECD